MVVPVDKISDVMQVSRYRRKFDLALRIAERLHYISRAFRNGRNMREAVLRKSESRERLVCFVDIYSHVLVMCYLFIAYHRQSPFNIPIK
ncbi:hypothetical protein SDC9_194690 [bioreactor metagenome]|uniref:Uncharacterized protein n=1 Tax=bioreactor metagenome TaxID=1076179 RepID=A0A645I7J8_9ZZZZ